MTLPRRMLLLLAVALMTVTMAVVTAGPALAAETYKGKVNGYGWKKNNGGVFPGGGNNNGGGGCTFACESA